jgi:hypothetical protein
LRLQDETWKPPTSFLPPSDEQAAGAGRKAIAANAAPEAPAVGAIAVRLYARMIAQQRKRRQHAR